MAEKPKATKTKAKEPEKVEKACSHCRACLEHFAKTSGFLLLHRVLFLADAADDVLSYSMRVDGILESQRFRICLGREGRQSQED